MTDLPSEIRFTFPLSATEEAQALKESMAHGPPRRIAKNMFGAMAALTIIQIAFSLNNPDIVDSLVSLAMPPAVVGILALLFPKPVPLRYFLRKVRQSSSASVGTRTGSFSKEGLFTSGPEGAELTRWEAFSDVVETDNFFLFYRPSGKSYYVPKYAVPVEHEMSLRELLGDVFMSRPNNLRLAAPSE